MDGCGKSGIPEIFTEIYYRNLWGGGSGDYYSGPGSHNEHIPSYAEAVAKFIFDNNIRRIVEIGCGDFNVSKQVLNVLEDRNYKFFYKGYDVVRSLIERNRMLYGSQAIEFIWGDSCSSELAAGDLLLVRQVLQHLDNESILQIVRKFGDYEFVLVTEHQLSRRYKDIIPNRDISVGASTRLNYCSGVYLDKEPFCCIVGSMLYSFYEETAGLDAFINTYLIERGGL